MNLPYYIVDVFAETKYAGNQLAVFLNAEHLTEQQMQVLAKEINFAESTFVTHLDQGTGSATIKIFTPEHEMKFAGHPIIGTSWVLMNKVFKTKCDQLNVNVPIGQINIKYLDGITWLNAAQPEFFDTFKSTDFLSFSNLQLEDFNGDFPIQEVSTGSAFVIIPLKSKEALQKIEIDTKKATVWLNANCKTAHKAFYFYYLSDAELVSRMLFIADGQIMEDAATGSASTCLQAFLLRYHKNDIALTNYQGEAVKRPSYIYFKGSKIENQYDITIGGKTQYIASGNWEV